MFIGGCGGSTAGGMKVSRVLASVKIILTELERSFRPNVVRSIRLGKNTLEYRTRIEILVFVLASLMLTALGTMILMVTEESKFIDGMTAFTATVACINNIGPGFAKVGAMEHYNNFSVVGKTLLSIFMAAGRLELYAVIVIFLPGFWRRN